MDASTDEQHHELNLLASESRQKASHLTGLTSHTIWLNSALSAAEMLNQQGVSVCVSFVKRHENFCSEFLYLVKT